MKSSTLHRSNLTKERMDLLREIKAQKHASNDSAPGIYVRPVKEKELDVLWQSFKVNQRSEKSASLYIVAGFVGGAIAMFLLTAIISFATHAFSDNSLKFQAKQSSVVPEVAKTVTTVPAVNVKKDDAVNFLPPDSAKVAVANVTPRMEQYTIKSGDTLDKIATRFYGHYDNAKIAKIAEVNNITNPHMISIGQVIKIPMN